MAESSSTLLQLLLMATGGRNNEWGDRTNENLQKLENAIAKATDIIDTTGTVTLSDDDARNAVLNFSGTLTGNVVVQVPTRSKVWLVYNGYTLGSYTLSIKAGSGGTPVTIPAGEFPLNIVWTDGTNVFVAGASEAAVTTMIADNARFLNATAGGSGNAITLTTAPASHTLAAGDLIGFVAGADNTGATTANKDSEGALNVYATTPAGSTACVGGEIKTGQFILLGYDGTRYQLLNSALPAFGAAADIASATTTDLGTLPSRNANITGTTTITGFGSSADTAQPLYFIRFAGALTLTHNATSLICLGGETITTEAGDYAIMEYLGSGNWRMRSYVRASGLPLVTPTIPLGTKVSGGDVLLQRVVNEITTSVNCTAAIPIDNTKPQISEGTQIFSQAFTPLNASSYLMIRLIGSATRSATCNRFGVALFKDTDADAIAAAHSGFQGGGYPIDTQMTVEWKIEAGSTSARTYTVRCGGDAALRWNGDNGGDIFGGVSKSMLVIEEYLAV